MQDMMFLIIIPNMYFGSKSDLTAIKTFHTIDHFEHGGFACSVITDDGYTFTSFDFKTYVLKQVLISKGFADPLNLHNVLATDTGRSKSDTHVIPDL